MKSENDLEPNLLVTYHHREMDAAKLEVKERLAEVGVGECRFLPSNVRGLFQIRVAGDARDVVRKLVSSCESDVADFFRTYKWIPIESWASSDLEAMREAVGQIASRIGKEKRWRLTVNKRFHRHHHTREIVQSLAEMVDNVNVDLESPDVEIRVEIIGDKAGFALLAPSDLLDINAVREKLGYPKIH